MSEIDQVTVKELLEHIKENNRDTKDNPLIHQITYWYHDLVKKNILRKHRE